MPYSRKNQEYLEKYNIDNRNWNCRVIEIEGLKN